MSRVGGVKTCERDGCARPVSPAPQARFCSDADCKRARDRIYNTSRRDPTRGRIPVAGPAHPCLHCGRPCVRLNARVCKDKACRALATLVRGKDRRADAPPRRYHGPPRPCVVCSRLLRSATPGGRICGQSCRQIRSGARTPWIHPAKRLRIYERDGWVCQLCDLPVPRWLLGDKRDPLAPTLDHVVPRSRGGGHEEWNLQLAHRRCNSSKRNGLPTVAQLQLLA